MKRIVSAVVLLTVLVGACTGFADADSMSAMMDECADALDDLVKRYETNPETFDNDYVYVTCAYIDLYLSLKYGNAAEFLKLVKDYGIAYVDESYITTEKPSSVVAETALMLLANRTVIEMIGGKLPDESSIQTLITAARMCIKDNSDRKGVNPK